MDSRAVEVVSGESDHGISGRTRLRRGVALDTHLQACPPTDAVHRLVLPARERHRPGAVSGLEKPASERHNHDTRDVL